MDIYIEIADIDKLFPGFQILMQKTNDTREKFDKSCYTLNTGDTIFQIGLQDFIDIERLATLLADYVRDCGIGRTERHDRIIDAVSQPR